MDGYGGVGIFSHGVSSRWRDRTKIVRFSPDGDQRPSPYIQVASIFSGRKNLFQSWLDNWSQLDFEKDNLFVTWIVSDCKSNRFIEKVKFSFNRLNGYRGKSLIISPDLPIFPEGGIDPEAWVRRNDGVTLAWNFFRRHMENPDYVLLWEDDVLIPPNALRKVLPFMENQHIGAVVMRCPYRPDGNNRGLPLAWNITPSYNIMNGTVEKKFVVSFMEAQDDGIEEVGGGTTGCQLIRARLMSSTPFINVYKGISGPDISYGQQLVEKGYKTLIHWGVHCGHMNFSNNRIEVFR